MDLTSLPDDSLVEVLGYLDTEELLRCRAVCRRLRDAALHPDLWRKRSLNLGWDGTCIDVPMVPAAVMRLAPCLGRLWLDSDTVKDQRFDRALFASTSCAISELHFELNTSDAAFVASVSASQAALGRLRSVSLTLRNTDENKPDVRMLLDQLIHTQGLTSLSLQWILCNPDSVDWSPSGDAVPSSLQRLEYQWQGGPLSSVLQWHADTLQVVRLLPLNRYYPTRQFPAGTAALLAALPNLRELMCPVLEDMPALLQCPALDTLHLTVLVKDKLTPLLRGAQQYLRQADRLESLTLDYRVKGYGWEKVCEDLVRCLAGPGSGAPSALRSLRLSLGGRDAREPLPQLPHLASVLPRLENLVSLDLGGPHTAEFLEAMDGQVLPRLERLRVYWPVKSEGCPNEWAHGQEVRGLLRRYHPRLHLELELEHSKKICYLGKNARRCRGFDCSEVYTLFSHPEHDGQCQQKHRPLGKRVTL